ncbi:MAG: SpoIID/LytB domain protein [Firmicutes bacterium]|nr:SpoIID/LytB domain protein [Bacillota bacterium]
MYKHIKLWLLLAVFLIFPLAGHAQPVSSVLSTAEPILHVGILTNQSSVELSASSKFSIINPDSAKVLATFEAKDTVTITTGKNGFSINNKPINAGKLELVMQKQSYNFSEQYLAVNKRRYRGGLTLQRTADKSGITVVNTLPIEQYLYGVIKNEISPEWPMEAVKAQAVAARTYALTNNTKHQAEGFDICATTDCQVYRGRDSEAPKALEAVDATRGLVLTYKGQLINAYFHSSSGGYTENSENVWSASQPYLRGVVDYDQNSPYYKWEKKLSLAELNQVIKENGYNIGSLQAIEVSPLTSPPVTSTDRGISGRVKTVLLKGTTGNIQLSGTKVRTMLNLKSTLFDIAIEKGTTEFVMPPLLSADRKKLSPDHSLLMNFDKITISPAPTIEPMDFVVITGYGWGHGLGLSQWGAKAMAEMGHPGNTEYFKDILRHYYKGVEIKKAY